MAERNGEGDGSLPPGKLRFVVTYLEMTRPPTEPRPVAPDKDLTLRRADRPAVAFYRELYDRVGKPWMWFERGKLSDQELAAIITDPAVEIHVLHEGNQLAGYVELDRRSPADVEIAYFGIVPERIGRGFGAYLMRWALDMAFGYGAPRVWLHTCTLDHPKAVDFYKRAGFRAYKTEVEIIDDPRLTGLVPRDSARHIPIDVRSVGRGSG